VYITEYDQYSTQGNKMHSSQFFFPHCSECSFTADTENLVYNRISRDLNFFFFCFRYVTYFQTKNTAYDILHIRYYDPRDMVFTLYTRAQINIPTEADVFNPDSILGR
jgi:hypothetical protein